MNLSLETRRKRIRIRAKQRGILEICVLFERFLNISPLINETEIMNFEQLLEETDRDIECWLSGLVEWPQQHIPILNQITKKLNL